MIEVLTAQHVPHALSQFLELQVSFSVDGQSFCKPGMVLDYEEDRQMLSFAVFNLAPEELPLLRRNISIDVHPGDNCLLWGWTAIAALSRSSIAVIDCLSCPAILQAVLKSLRKNNNRLFINVPPTHTQYAREISEEYRKLISFVPNFSDLAREHTFSGVVALGTIASLQDWFKYNSMRCHYFAALII